MDKQGFPSPIMIRNRRVSLIEHDQAESRRGRMPQVSSLFPQSSRFLSRETTSPPFHTPYYAPRASTPRAFLILGQPLTGPWSPFSHFLRLVFCRRCVHSGLNRPFKIPTVPSFSPGSIQISVSDGIDRTFYFSQILYKHRIAISVQRVCAYLTES